MSEESKNLAERAKKAERNNELLRRALRSVLVSSVELDRLKADNRRLRDALKALYADTVSYITVNHLGDTHHNKSMRDAGYALSKSEAEAE